MNLVTFETNQQPHHRRRKFMFLFGKAVVLVLLLFSVATVYAEAPLIQQTVNRIVQTVAVPFTPKPKSLIESDQALPTDVQSAIQTLAQQEIKQEQAAATLPFIVPSEMPNENIFQSIGSTFEEIVTRDPVDRAKLRVKKINQLILKLQHRLNQDKSAKAVSDAIGLMQKIGTEIDAIVADPKVQTDREVLTLQIEQYNRLQLIIQQLEDTLPFPDVLKVEDARKKYLVATAIKSINTAPSLETIHSIAVPLMANFVGDDFAELKALETITDFEDDVTPEARQKLLALEKQLATAFEKRMLELPQDVRNRKLQSYIHYSYGDPLLQVRVFEHMKDTLSDRELIMGVDSLKEVAIQRLADRIFELDNQQDVDAYIDRIIGHSQDIKVLGEVQMAVDSGGDSDRVARFAKLEESMHNRVVLFLDNATPEQLETFLRPIEEIPTRVVDVVMVDNLAAMVATTPELTAEVKLRLAQVKQQTRDRFINQVVHKDFLTQSKLAFNAVVATADVRIVSTHPQGIAMLQNLRSQVPAQQRAAIDKAIRASSIITAEHVLFQINDPSIFTDYQQFITKNTSINQSLKRYAGRNFAENLAKKSAVIQQEALAEKQQLYEVMQQITQSIFTDHSQTRFEKQLPPSIMAKINSLKRSLPTKSIPKLIVPEGVTLSPIAALPHDVDHAIIQAAKARIRQARESEAVKLDLTVSAADLGVTQPKILPGNLLYPLKQLRRRAQLMLTFDGLSRAELLVKQNNERTLEVALLLEKSSSRKNIDLALQTLADIQTNFELLKKSTDKQKLAVLRQQQPEKLDRLISAIVQSGLARQTVFASIEDRVYGADYVRVEKIRQQVLRDGMDTLLQLSDGNVQLLVDRLEQAVTNGNGSLFKELKAIELLTEIKRSQPEKIRQTLEAAEIHLVKTFETNLLAMDKVEREKELLAYAGGLPGNPVRQYETYEELRKSFTNKDTITLVNQLENQAIENLTEIVSGITDESTLHEFAIEVVGTKLQDLEILVEAGLHVQAPDVLDTVQTPIEQAIEEIKTMVEQEIVQEFIENPASLTESNLFTDASNQGNTTVADVIVVRDLVEIIEQSPEATPEIIETVKELQQQVIHDVIEETTTQVDQNLADQQTLLQETIAQVEEEIFSGPVHNPSSVEQTLPQTIQNEIDEIKTEVPPEQIPTVNTTTETVVTVESVQTSTQTQTEITPTIESAPAAPAPIQEAPTAPAPAPAVGL